MENPGAEWLETDGFGGYASGTVGFVRTRRYHGLLLVAHPPPATRLMLVNGVDAWLERETGPDLPLTRQHYAPDITTAETPPARFTPSPWPSWQFALADDQVLTFELFIPEDGAETVLRWHPPTACRDRLVVRPGGTIMRFTTRTPPSISMPASKAAM